MTVAKHGMLEAELVRQYHLNNRGMVPKDVLLRYRRLPSSITISAYFAVCVHCSAVSQALDQTLLSH